MTYTADDFARAEFARHPDGRIAYRDDPSSEVPWTWSNHDGGHDSDMAAKGWVPVQESRPLTADDITHEMVERVQQWAVGLRSGAVVYLGTEESVRAMFSAALTPPPKRSEGAEDIEVLLFDVGVDENRAEVANYLAARLTDPTRKEA